MEVIGGNFGASGKVTVKPEQGLFIDGDITTHIKAGEISMVETKRNENRQFGPVSFLVAGALFGVVGWWLGGVVGLAVGLLIALATSFSKQTSITAKVLLSDGRHLEVKGWHYEIQKLARLAMNK